MATSLKHKYQFSEFIGGNLRCPGAAHIPCLFIFTQAVVAGAHTWSLLCQEGKHWNWIRDPPGEVTGRSHTLYLPT